MPRYKNLSGNSGVAAYEIEPGQITVQFTDGSVYLYNERRPGQTAVETMQHLAIEGSGLNSYINTFVKGRYARKLR